MSLQGASDPLLHSIGVFGDFPSFVLAYYVVFAFPEGRLAGWPERLLLAGWALTFLTFFPYLLFSPVVSGGGPVAGCNAACPTNAFMIADRPTIADPFGSEFSYVTIAVGAATLAFLFYRLVTATRPRRRALTPVYALAMMLTVPVLIFHGVVTHHLDLDPSTISHIGWFVTVGRALLPYGFVLSIVVSTFFAATALKKIVSRLVESPSASQLRTTLADALDDPSLELGFRLEQAGGFVDSSGKPLPSTPPAGQSSTPVTRNGDTVAVIMHDAALDTDPELVAAAGQALLLAIENGRLAAELQSTNTELRATRARIVATGDAQRRRIERDLHDGAQQHLVALSIRVGLARELADPEAAQRLDDVGKELEEILEELRDLAHGLYPPLLREFGLREALASAVRRSASAGEARGSSDRPLPRRGGGRRLLLLRGKSPERRQARRIGCDRCHSALGARWPALLRDRRRRRRLRRRIGPTPRVKGWRTCQTGSPRSEGPSWSSRRRDGVPRSGQTSRSPTPPRSE